MKRRSWLWALAALAFAATSHGRFLFPASAWLAPVFLVRFVRTAPRRIALPGFVLVHTLALEAAFLDLVPLPLAAHIGMFVALSLVLGGVFLADRWCASSSGSLATTLVLPAGWVAYDFASGLFSPNGSWGSIAYGLAGQLPVVQVVSLTGWTGLTFLLAWFGSTVNWIWEARETGRPTTRGFVALGTGLILVLGFGIARLATAAEAPTFRAALLSGPDTFQGPHLEEVWAYTRGIEQTAEQVADARAQIASRRERQFARVREAFAQGARLAAWAEVCSAVTEDEEAEWLEQGAATAQEAAGYVGLGLFVFRPRSSLAPQNRFVLFGPEGELLWDFSKAKRVPGDRHEVGDGRLPDVATDLGRLSGAICFDMDFPRLFHQAGENGTDVLIAPSNDWPEVRHTHADMARLRAVEQGFHLVRPTKDGVALASDAYGRELGRLETLEPRDSVLLADVPVRGVRTLYGRVGDTFAWVASAAFLGLILHTRLRRAGADVAPAATLSDR